MKWVRRVAGGAAAALACMGMAATAQATVYRVDWSGAFFGDNATAVGYFNIDPAAYPQIGNGDYITLPDPAFQVLSLTVSGASAGDGVFGPGDFSSAYFWSPDPLDMNTQLIGQFLPDTGLTYGANFDAPASTGDFNVFGATESAPSGQFFFTLGTNGGSGDLMEVTSIAPLGAAVPEPATWAMLILGVGLVGLAARRRRDGLAAVA